MKRANLAVSLAGAIRPVLGPLNRELESRNARAVARAEWPELDDILHEITSASLAPGMRCSYCSGYVNADADGDFTCLNCARSAIPRHELDDLIETMAGRLIESRGRQR